MSLEILGCALFIWCFFSTFCNFVNGIGFDWAGFKIKLPKRESKYKGRKSPIYELVSYSGWDEDYYGIAKWELDYHRVLIPIFWFICPVPLCFYSYKYGQVGTLCMFKKNSVHEIKRPLNELYEEKYAEENAEELAKLKAKNTLKNKIDELNDEFTKNYIKSKL